MMLVDKHTIELTEKINASSKGGLISVDFLRGLQCSVSFSCVGQSYIYQVLQTIQMKLILLCVWAEPAVLGSAKTALKFIYKI